MDPSFWLFLSVAVFMGMLPAIIAIIAKHRISMKQLEVEALRIKHANLQTSEQGFPQSRRL